MENDQIEREIFIAAPLEKVWLLFSEPAWWVGDAPGPNSVHVDGKRVVAETRFGNFPVEIERMDPPNYLACRWASSFPGEEPREGNSTLVEFTLTAKDEGTMLRVVESGFANLTTTHDERMKFFRENSDGWKQQLDYLRQRAEKTVE
ncbi:polyketide cyclase [Bacillus salipaludis]|uniref:Polyketide cyclase n=1 Tax=Bacillus salipaludis TaxID=2547811 RepID=A0A4R5VM73_9BACI|nr:SRPBCC domain-containing protein [Bacillus salipaludis]MDQ6596248.1 SRPBCC domain-containing protein [Bacillus salipaludis]TDK58434.1 polyketide cyclase [Bacillus salipaludis]